MRDCGVELDVSGLDRRRVDHDVGPGNMFDTVSDMDGHAKVSKRVEHGGLGLVAPTHRMAAGVENRGDRPHGGTAHGDDVDVRRTVEGEHRSHPAERPATGG